MGYLGSRYDIPRAISYLLKGDYTETKAFVAPSAHGVGLTLDAKPYTFNAGLVGLQFKVEDDAGWFHAS